MGALAKGIYDGLRGESSITDDLSAYESGFPIFSSSPIPPNAPWPFLVFSVAQGWENFDTKTTVGDEVFIDIGIYDEATGSAIIIDRLAENVKAFFHRTPASITVAGFNVRIINATGPVANNTEDVYGRIIPVRIVLEES